MKRAKAAADELSVAIEGVRAKYDLPALAAVSFGRGVVRESAVVGVRKYGDPTPAALTDAFHLGSCTKSMTATLAVMLVDEKKLGWEMTLADFFPEHTSTIRPEYRAVTLRMLLNQRSGFSGETWPTGSPRDWRRAPGTLADQRRLYVKLALADASAAAPGTKFIYANRNYIVVGAILEKITGIAWEDLISARMFRPLKMPTAGFGSMATPPDHVDGLWPHVVQGGRHIVIPPGPGADNPLVLGPAGTVHCSIEDWARYGLFHLKSAQLKSTVISPGASRELYAPPAGSDYAMGWMATERSWGGGRVLTHAGSNTMNFAVIWLAPGRDFGVAAATNQGNNGADKACDDVSALMIGRYLKG